MNNVFFFMASLIMVFSLFGFNQQKSYAHLYEDDSVMQETMLEIPDSIIQGKASFYGSEFNGRKTANGEIYDETAMTAAHRTLPFGTVLRVTNLRNGLSVIVRINDRGPFHPDRVIDLSKNAAEEIDLIKYGITDIEAEILEQ
jgi:rare lipoprotein A (peptidoglycan hydrolase)